MIPNWKTARPPLKTEIEYQRDDGAIEIGSLAVAGRFGSALVGEVPRMRQLYRREGHSETFEVRKWRGLERRAQGGSA